MGLVSSNTLFHFTSTFDNMKGILKDEFIPRYSLEKMSLGGHELEFAIPMVCFCDIPLSNIANHIEKYGNYAIGMSMEWAQEKKLNPIMYIRDESDLSKQFWTLSGGIFSDTSESNKDMFYRMLDILRYVKPYEGQFSRISPQYMNDHEKFYDEREWRFVVPFEDVEKKRAFLLPREFEELQDKNLPSNVLSFNSSDIKYLIVSDETEIHEMLDSIQKVKSFQRFRDLELLYSRIITTEQIKSDF